MFRMHEHGLQERENSRMYTKKPKCIGGAGNFITASLIDTKPAILVLIWGFLIAPFVLTAEMAYHRFTLKQLKLCNKRW